jgi:hypothetical protein
MWPARSGAAALEVAEIRRGDAAGCVSVVAGRRSGRSGQAEDLAGDHLLADADKGAYQLVAVAGDNTVGMADVDVPAFSALDLGGHPSGWSCSAEHQDRCDAECGSDGFCRFSSILSATTLLTRPSGGLLNDLSALFFSPVRPVLDDLDRVPGWCAM